MNLGDLDSIGEVFFSQSQNKYYYINGKGEFQEFPTSSGDYTLPYTEAVLNCSQAVSFAPTVLSTVYNSTGATFSWSRTSAGLYVLTATSEIFTENKIAWEMTSYGAALIRTVKFEFTSSTEITLNTYNDAGSNADVGGQFQIQLRIYS